MPRRPLLPSAISGPGRSTACASTIRRETGASTCVILRPVAGEGRHWPLDLLKQGADLRAVVSILVGQHRRDDPTRAGVRGEMQLAPATTPLAPVLLDQPLTGSTKLQPRAVHQQVHGLAARLRS